MRYLIIGAGAVGGTVGGRLAQAGREVVLVARGRHLTALREHGLRLRVPEGESTHRLPAVDGPGPLGELRADDVLMLAVKTQDTVAALEAWADVPVAGGGTAARRLPLVCLQNGVESARLALRRFRHVYGVCVWLPSTFVEPGVVSAAGTPLTGVLHLGRVPHGTDDTARRIAADLADARFEAPVVPDVARWQYAKLLGNLGNALEAVSGPVASEEAQALYARASARRARRCSTPPGSPTPALRSSARPAATRSPWSRWTAPARRRLLLAVPGPGHRHDRGGPPQRRDRPARPAARRPDPAERTAATPREPVRARAPGARFTAGRRTGPAGRRGGAAGRLIPHVRPAIGPLAGGGDWIGTSAHRSTSVAVMTHRSTDTTDTTDTTGPRTTAAPGPGRLLLRPGLPLRLDHLPLAAGGRAAAPARPPVPGDEPVPAQRRQRTPRLVPGPGGPLDRPGAGRGGRRRAARRRGAARPVHRVRHPHPRTGRQGLRHGDRGLAGRTGASRRAVGRRPRPGVRRRGAPQPRGRRRAGSPAATSAPPPSTSTAPCGSDPCCVPYRAVPRRPNSSTASGCWPATPTSSNSSEPAPAPSGSTDPAETMADKRPSAGPGAFHV